MMMGGTASQDGSLACIVVIDQIIVVIYLIKKSSPNLNRQLYANETSFLLKIKKKSAQVISFTANSVPSEVRNWAIAQYRHTICAVKSLLSALETFQT